MTTLARIELTVVVDSVLRMRETQLWPQPDVGEFAAAAVRAGANGVLLSLHASHVAVRDREAGMLGDIANATLCLAVTPRQTLLRSVVQSRAQRCVLVPGARHEHSSGGSLAVNVVRDTLVETQSLLHGSGIELAARIDPDVPSIEVCSAAGLRAVEFNTSGYALAGRPASRERRLEALRACVAAAHREGMRVSLRGGLDFDNVANLAAIEHVGEIRVGQALVARALFDGIQSGIAKMRGLLGGDSS